MPEEMSIEDGHLLLKLARENILRQFGEQKESLSELEKKIKNPVIKRNRGTFVSLHKQKGELRGCIGNIEPVKSLLEGVKDNARHAAFRDTRFRPLAYEELEETLIEISILTRPAELEYSDSDDLIRKLKPGVDGVIIEKHNNRATFLPQVWDQLKDPHAFLGHLCTKAGLPSDEWKKGSLKVSLYQVQSFEEKMISSEDV